MEIWELIARESIRDLVARYNANGDSGRIDQMLELFAKDAIMKIEPGREYHGCDEIRGLFSGAAERTRQGQGAKFIRHNTATHQIDLISETQAKGRCYFTVLTDRGLDHWGRYIDEYRLIDGKWMFWHRICRTDARVEGSWAQSTSEAQGYE